MLTFGWGRFVVSHCGNCFACYKVKVNYLAYVILVLQLSTVQSSYSFPQYAVKTKSDPTSDEHTCNAVETTVGGLSHL